MLAAGSEAVGWPQRSVEALLSSIDPKRKNAVSVLQQVEQKLAGGQAASSSGVVRSIEEGLAHRGLLEKHRRGFGLLQASYRLPETSLRAALAQRGPLELELRAIEQAGPDGWIGMARAITVALNTGIT